MSETQLCAGFARLDITPPLGVMMSGYNAPRYADGVLDPLYVNAVAFGRGEDAAVLLVCDTLGVYGQLGCDWPGIVAKAAGIDEKAVFVCHTHTHTGPALKGTMRETPDPMYDEWLTRRLCDAARLALADRRPVTEIRGAETETEGLAFVRRFKRRDGTYQTWAKGGAAEIEAPACEADRTLRTVRVLREDAPEIVLVNFQVHPDCTGGTKYSADYPGALRDYVEAHRENVRCVYLDGAEGQMVRGDAVFGKSRPWEKGRAGAKEYGEILARIALETFDKAAPLPEDGFGFDRVPVTVPSKFDPDALPEADRVIALYQAGRFDEITAGGGNINLIVSELYNQRWLADHGGLRELPFNVTAIAFGGLALIGFPGEPFAELGVAVRKASPYPVTCMCCQTNGMGGYLPTAEAYDQGGYEPTATRMGRGGAEKLVDAAEKLLQKLHRS